MEQDKRTIEELFLSGCLASEASEKSEWEKYRNQYLALKDYLKDNLYGHIVGMSRVSDNKGYLTDHGINHVNTVIDRISQILNKATSIVAQKLDWYNAYILLAAISFHDAGMVSGREEHEKEKLREVMKMVEALIAQDAREKRLIYKIAQVHGGKIKGRKDTISSLDPTFVVMNRTVYPRLLAALLRFADELADDRTRASRFLLKLNKIPKESEVFHKYAEALNSVRVIGNLVELYFEFTISDALRQFGKGSEEVYLFDEIKTRTNKMHYERMYCMRFLRQWVQIDRVRVSVTITNDSWEEIKRISYFIDEDGYPSEDLPGRFSSDGMAEEVSAITGETLAELLRDAAKMEAIR
jgi:hypothetical protein